MRPRYRSVVMAAAVLACAATWESFPTGAAAPVEIGVKGRANADASMAASGTVVGVVWAARTADGVTDIYAAMSRDGGRSFRPPVRVNHIAGDASASGEQPPRIALPAGRTGEPDVVVMWTAKSPAGTRLVSARSTDGGQSFTPASPVPGSDASGNRGWESMALTAEGQPVAVWLDHREVPARPAGGGSSGSHQHGSTARPDQTDGAARAQLSQIFFARLDDASSARAIAPGVCYCCKTSLATAPDGSIVAAWRHVYPGSVRDIALVKSSDGGRTFTAPVRVSDDNWVLDGCPENGPAVAIDQANTIHVVWPTVVSAPGREPAPALFHAMSKDGRRFTARQQLPTAGVPRHPQLAVHGAGGLTVAWDEQSQGTRQVVVAGATNRGGPPRFVREPIASERGVYPVVASVADATVVAWTAGTSGATVLRIQRRPTAR